MNWRIVIDVTAESRETAEFNALFLMMTAARCGPDGTSNRAPSAFLECGDPGLSHSPQDVDYSIATPAECEAAGYPRAEQWADLPEGAEEQG